MKYELPTNISNIHMTNLLNNVNETLRNNRCAQLCD